MHQSLLAHGHHEEEEDDLLWNELKDDAADGAHLHHHRSAREPAGAAQLPSLRAHAHLPAISSLFHSVVDSARGAFSSGGSRKSGRSAHSSHEQQAPDASVWRSHAPDQLGRVHNLDAFLISLYNYFYHKGFWSIAVVELVALLTGLFSVALSSFLMGCVQWHRILECNHRAEPCEADLEEFVSCRVDDYSSVLTVLTAFYFVMFLGYWLFRALALVGTLRDAYGMAAFYLDRLHIDDRQLQTIKWDEVVNRVLDLVGPSRAPNALAPPLSSYRLQVDPALLATPHDFARRILRRENYLIAFMTHALFQHGNRLLPPALQVASMSHVMFSRNMECNLSICLIDQMLDGENRLARAFVQDAAILQKRFLVAGVVNFVLTPFLLIYRASHYLFVLAMEWHMHRGIDFGTRRWSSYALWKFRDYNELPHVLEARMARSFPAAERYLSMFPAGVGAVVAGGVSFCASSLMAVLIGLSLVDESLLLKTTLGGFPLIWYLTVATIVFGVAHTFTTTTSPFLVNGDSEEAMMQLSAETHFFPTEWRGRCESYDVRDEFLSLYPYKGVLLLQECLSVIMAPYILCVSLPRVAREILLFVRSHTLVLPQAGAVCRFAEFDFKEYGHDVKMERSFVNFKQNHPQWVGAQEGEALVQRLGQLKEEAMDKSMRMGDTVLYGSHLAMSMSQQLLQSQAIHTALGGGMTPQDNEFYWLEKLQQRGRLGELGMDESKATDSASISSLT